MMLCAVCHLTGGYSFRIDEIDKGISLFQSDSFLDVEERKNYSGRIIKGDRSTIPMKINPKMITEEFMNRAKENAEFDSEKPSKPFNTYRRLATPAHIIAVNNDKILQDNRTKRILKEVQYAFRVNDYNDEEYDPEMKILLDKTNIERWHVFIKAPKESIYGEKWWYLFVTFPDLYPNEQPIIKFISVPYHINISEDGRICHPIIEKGYLASFHVVEIIQRLKELFFLPCPDAPILQS